MQIFTSMIVRWNNFRSVYHHSFRLYDFCTCFVNIARPVTMVQCPLGYLSSKESDIWSSELKFYFSFANKNMLVLFLYYSCVFILYWFTTGSLHVCPYYCIRLCVFSQTANIFFNKNARLYKLKLFWSEWQQIFSQLQCGFVM